MNVLVTPQSQTERLRDRAREADIAHGDVVRADVDNVRVEVGAAASLAFWRPLRQDAEIFFCNIGPIRIRERLRAGDREPLPMGVDVEGIEVESSGRYDLVNALIRSNGRIEVVVDRETTVRRSEDFERRLDPVGL
jgi:hypothetical protein